MSATSPRSRSSAIAALLLLTAAGFFAGCPAGGAKPVLPPGEEELLLAKGDPRLRAAVRDGGTEPFAALAAFRGDWFLRHSAKLEESPVPLLNEFGNAALVLLRPGQVVPFLKDPDVVRLAWFCPQGRLARLDPALELDIMARFGAGTEGKEREILLRWKNVPGDADERAVTAAGFRIVTRAGPNLVVSGPFSGMPGLLGIDRIIYMEKASRHDPGVTFREGVPTRAGSPAVDNKPADNALRKDPRVPPFHKKPPPVELPPEGKE